MNNLSSVVDPRDFVPEYEEKLAALPSLLENFNESISKIEQSCTIAGAYSGRSVFRDRPSADLKYMQAALLGSAWKAAFTYCNMDILATAKDKKEFERSMQNPPPFTEDNLVKTFGPYLANQRDCILRGLAEAFIQLDDAYKSHSKVKVGVKGLPKRVILNNVSQYRYGWGWQMLEDMLNALKVFDGDGLVDRDILNQIANKERTTYRGMTFKWFKNGNVHIHFNEHACLQINRGLAEYYGDVLPDVEPDKEDLKADPNARSVSKDLQYYPTPISVAKTVVTRDDLYRVKKILEPSCGCGRLIDVVMDIDRKRRDDWREDERPEIKVHGIEYDLSRANQAREKGYHVTVANFLDVPPDKTYDLVIMNPPFYGKHYLKHIDHAMKFVRDGGDLISILPATAHYDHKLLPSGYRWRDLPVGSFSTSGTKVPTGYAKWHIRPK